MGWDGSGNFNRTNGTNSGAETWQDDAAASTKILADRHDTHDQDLADAIGACITKDNQSKPTANFLPNADSTYTLGSNAVRWSVGYFDEISDQGYANISALLSARQTTGVVIVQGYHAATQNLNLLYRWDTTQDRANHNGGTIIDPSITFPSDWTNQTQVATWFTASSGTGCWMLINNRYNSDSFGTGSGNDDTKAFQAFFDAYQGTVCNLTISPKAHTVSATVNVDLGEGSTINAEGAVITCTHDGAAFDLNPDAYAQIPLTTDTDAYTKRDQTWNGGRFLNTNGTKTASCALRLYFLRKITVSRVYATGFFAAFRYGAKDTYLFDNNYTFNNTYHYYLEDGGVLFTESITGNDVAGVMIKDSHLSCNLDTGGAYFGNRVVGLKIDSCLFNGGATNGQVIFHDNNTLESRSITMVGNHHEQVGAAAAAIIFHADNSVGFANIEIGGASEFISGVTSGGNPVTWQGIILDKCLGVTLDQMYFLDGSNGNAETGIYIDNDSRDIYIGAGITYSGFPSNVRGAHDGSANASAVTDSSASFTTNALVGRVIHNVTDGSSATITANTATTITGTLSGGTDNDWDVGDIYYISNKVTFQKMSNRANVSSSPGFWPEEQVLTGYSAQTFSTGQTVVDMSTAFTNWDDYLIPPKGYSILMSVSDSGSGAGTAITRLRKDNTVSTSTGLILDVSGETNSDTRYISGIVPATYAGDMLLHVTATGGLSTTVTLVCNGVVN